jgi:hypothetical protein
MQFPWDPGAVEEIGYENIVLHKFLLVSDGTSLLLLAKVVYMSQELSVSHLAVH